MLEGVNVEVLVIEAKKLYFEAKNPKIISDNGSQFVSKDFEEILTYLEVGYIFSSANHSQSNIKLGRFNRT
jgi:transposase InsO family protein